MIPAKVSQWKNWSFFFISPLDSKADRLHVECKCFQQCTALPGLQKESNFPQCREINMKNQQDSLCHWDFSSDFVLFHTAYRQNCMFGPSPLYHVIIHSPLHFLSMHINHFCDARLDLCCCFTNSGACIAEMQLKFSQRLRPPK